MNFLFPSGGRRFEMVNIFKKELPQDCFVVGDITNTAPALYAVDQRIIIPRFNNPECLEYLCNLCSRLKIDAIIPFTDPEIDFFNDHMERFLQQGTKILLSNSTVINVVRNKWKTYCLLKELGIPVAETFDRKEDVRTFPIIAKPSVGSASTGVFRIKNAEELWNRSDINEGYIYQELIKGEEITVDVITDGSGDCQALSQRLRLKVRAGEVERAVTVFDETIDQFVQQIVKLLKLYGIINIQFFRTSAKKIIVQEINARIGGGCPLTYQAGINVPQLLKDILNHSTRPTKIIRAKEGVYMLRFDQACYLTKEQLIQD